MEDKSFQGRVVEGFQITIPKATRVFGSIEVGDFLDITITAVKHTGDVE